ncbi:hypothetical protein Pla175_05120 [Pirellulimonas nuda]|uniref:DUF1570 domain-containing protein n=1 Tax=Pirellulimonas nuda TaxID=2528009 RepID=A0A518D6S3_9BACT|nr:hypothetical protein [Pirellulimonas nuda]QDU87156.1 hypothetical protein Pla175_05120 [Pirellulimonas nuda]
MTRTVLLLLLLTRSAFAEWPPPPPLDADRLAAAGLRVVSGPRLELVTDLPPSPAIDELPSVVEAAMPAWDRYFAHTGEQAPADWRLRMYLVRDRQPLEALGLMPDRGGDFLNGLSLGYEAWVAEQSTDYYRRHLVLHEATHSYMATVLGGCGPGWYMEAMAELLGTHAWDPGSGRLELGVMPASRGASAYWGRVKSVRDAFAAGKALSVPAVMKIDNRQVLGPDSYAWVWSLAKLLDSHPRYQPRFRDLPKEVLREDFDDGFRAAFADDWSDLALEWRLFVSRLDYGYQVAPEAIDFRPGRPLAEEPAEVTVAADRGWQSTGVAVEAGRPVRLSASGRFVVHRDAEGTPWPCEAGGVTLEYFAGRPLGMLLAAIDQRESAGGEGGSAWFEGSLLRPVGVGPEAELVPLHSGTLYLRVNDSPAAVAENQGELRVIVQRVKRTAQ